MLLAGDAVNRRGSSSQRQARRAARQFPGRKIVKSSGLRCDYDNLLAGNDFAMPGLIADSDDARALRPEKYQLEVEIFDWEAERKWWLDHLDRCFPAWMKSGRLKLSLHTRESSCTGLRAMAVLVLTQTLGLTGSSTE